VRSAGSGRAEQSWTGTWNFVTITLSMLQHDLVGQREGMMLPSTRPTTSAPRAMPCSSDLAQPGWQPARLDFEPDGDPTFAVSGISRSMLAAGIGHLRPWVPRQSPWRRR